MKETTFVDLISSGALEIGDGYRAKNEELGGEGPIFLRAALLTPDGFEWSGAERFAMHGVHRLTPKMGKPGDTVITTKGNSVGRTGFVPKEAPPFVYSPHLSYWRSIDDSVLCPGFMRYWARGPEFASQLQALAHGTDMAPYLSLTDQRRLRISLPSISEQRAISEMLATLDEKIESNVRGKKHCLELARLHYELHSSGAATSELGHIANLVLGGTPSRRAPEFWHQGDVPWINSGAANRDIILEPTERITREALAHSAAKLMPSGATVLAITGATLGQVALLAIESTGNQSLVGIWADDSAMTGWLHFAVSSAVPELMKRATGAAQQHVNKLDVARLIVRVPDSASLVSWARVGLPLMSQAIHFDQESKVCLHLRDVLLPELLSGRMRVEEPRCPSAPIDIERET